MAKDSNVGGLIPSLVPIHKRLFRPISALRSKFYPRNINYIPVVKFFAGLDLDQNSSFLDGHSLTFDSRDNIFTPIQGTYAELQAGLFSQALGGDDAFQRLRLISMQFIPLQPRLYLGIRGDEG